MGFLDNLGNLNDKLKDVLGDAVEDAIEDLSGVKVDLDKQSETPAASSPATPAPAADAPVVPGTGDIVKYFDDILASDFSAYTVKKVVSAASLGFGAVSPCKDYDYALFSGAAPVAVIMLTPHNRDNNAAFRNARDCAKVPFINFYTHMTNERSYVVKRIKSFL